MRKEKREANVATRHAAFALSRFSLSAFTFHLSAFNFQLSALILVLLLAGCGTKKNTPLSRNWQAFTTRYNVYYNGSEHYKETLKKMEEGYEDDFSRQLLMHPAEARADSKLTQPTGDFKRTIEKMQKAIQLHSITKKPAKRSSSPEDKAFRNREEFNPFLHNAWLMMGKAQYLNGDFLGAATTFLYISRHFTWLPEVVTEARLWQARCYCALGWNYEAENALHAVKEKDLVNKNLRHLYADVSADRLLLAGQDAQALPYLREAAESASGMQKHRLWFLVGQVSSRLGLKEQAYEAFKKAGSGASTPYRMKFNARIKESEVSAGQNVAKEISSLKRMTRYGRNKEFLDQIYYAIGNLCMTRRDTTEAVRNYRLAVEKSQRNGIDKALAQLALGNIYFRRHDYVKAQPCYSEAVPLLPDNYPGYKALRLRSDVLDELAVYAGNVHLQDSLLTLAHMPEQERLAACQKLVDDLKKREREQAEAAAREEYLANQEGVANPMDKNTPSVPNLSMNSDKSWYFYNTMTRNAGKTEFQRRWGARKLEDDWRRRNKATFSLEDETAEDDQEGTENETENTETATDSIPTPDAAQRAQDSHNVEYYLAQIPSTPEQERTANDIIQEGLYNMGLILKDKLEDYPSAREEFETLLSRYPDNVYRLDVYYNLYLMAVRDNDKALAEKWRQEIISNFPDSPYGMAMRDPNYFENLRRMHDVQEEMYEKAYAAYLDNDNATVQGLTAEMEKDYPLSPILPKFVFIDALSSLTDGNTERFRDRLTELLQKWPDTDMTPMASGILKHLREGREPHAGLTNARGMIWQTRLSDAAAENPDSIAATFSLDPEAPQYVVLAFPLDSVNPNVVLYDVARFNFSSFVVRDFDLEPMSFSNVGLLVVKGFANLREAERYRTVMERSDTGLPPEVRPIIIGKADFETLLREGRSFEDYFRYRDEKAVEKAEDDVLNQPAPGDVETENEE